MDSVKIQAGGRVSAGQVLAELDPSSLPRAVILAQAELIQAQQALDDLLNNQVRAAQAQKAVEEAEKALQDARDPALAQAQARQALAAAQKELDAAVRYLETIESPAPEAALQQARTSMQQAEKVLSGTQKTADRIRNRLNRPESTYIFFESKKFYRRILENLELKLIQDQKAYDAAANRYEALLVPPDPLDLALAQANVAGRQAQVVQAQLDVERLQSGPAAGDIAVLEARLEDARREFLRVQDGPGEDEIAAARARVTAAQAAVNSTAITAPFDGVITGANNLPGDLVSPGELAFRLDDLDTLLVDALVSEMDINRVQLGQTAVLRFDAVPSREYRGEVAEVPAVGNSIGGVVSFKIKVKVLDGDDQVRPGMTSSVTIVVGDLKDALLVPNRAVRILDGERVVYVRRGDELLPVVVKLGLASDSYSQVLESSLQAGDLIALEPPVN